MRLLNPDMFFINHYSDSGKWQVPSNKNSFGFELIDILTELMNGEKKVTIDNGTEFSFIFNPVNEIIL